MDTRTGCSHALFLSLNRVVPRYLGLIGCTINMILPLNQLSKCVRYNVWRVCWHPTIQPKPTHSTCENIHSFIHSYIPIRQTSLRNDWTATTLPVITNGDCIQSRAIQMKSIRTNWQTVWLTKVTPRRRWGPAEYDGTTRMRIVGWKSCSCMQTFRERLVVERFSYWFNARFTLLATLKIIFFSLIGPKILNRVFHPERVWPVDFFQTLARSEMSLLFNPNRIFTYARTDGVLRSLPFKQIRSNVNACVCVFHPL